jgi:tetraacyldisaccharide 4'-kinase
MLNALSRIYGFIVGTRNRLYDAGILSTRCTGIPVVSVGNVEAGGTGKTPFTIALARELVARGYRPAIVTRGYRGRLKGVVPVSPDSDSRDVGDEALLMARVAGVPVIKSPDRVRGALYARDVAGAGIVLLDDGFQHRRIHRDLDIVLVSRDWPESLLPAGRLREPGESLSGGACRGAYQGASGSGITAARPHPALDVSGSAHDTSILKGRKVLAVSGIARPGNFARTLELLGAEVDAMPFRDHHAFTAHDMRKILARARDRDLVITTEKDMVRMRPTWLDTKWLALRVEMHIDGMEEILGEIERIVKDRRIPGQG